VTVDNLHTFVSQKETEIGVQFDKFKQFTTDEKHRDDLVIAELSSDRQNIEKARADTIAAANEAKETLAKTAEALRPRELSTAQQTAAVNVLKNFPDIIAAVWRADVTSPDTVPLSYVLMSVLTKAHWKVRGVSVAHGGAYGIGVTVGRRINASPLAVAAADALVKELLAARIPAGYAPDFKDESTIKSANMVENIFGGPTPDIIIFVGTK